MKKTRNLAAAAFCGALMILGMQSQAAAQQVEKPGNLGENKGTGDVIKRMGSWDLVKIEETMTPYGFSEDPVLYPREKWELPVKTREAKGTTWRDDNRIVTAQQVFKNLKETVTQSNFGAPSDLSLQVFVKAAVTGERRYNKVNGENPEDDFVVMKCTLDFTSPSGDVNRPTKDDSYRRYHIYAGSYYPARPSPFEFSKKGEFECGAAAQWGWVKPEEDFTLNYRLLVNDGFRIGYNFDVTFHFYYKWRGWDYVSPGTPTSPGGVDVGVLDRDGQYRWAQKQDASALESRLISNAARLFGSPSVNSEKLSSAFADVSVIIADRAGKANFSADDKDAASTNWSTHKNWAARQGPKGALENLQQKLSAAFKYLSRSQKDLFFADVSVAMAKAEVAGPANEAAAAQEGPTVKPAQLVFGLNQPIDIAFSNPKASGWDWIVIAQPSKLINAAGPHSSLSPTYALQFDPNNNSQRDLRSTQSFPPLPEGEYEARYISWGGGNNLPVARVPFRVGRESSGKPPIGATSKDLSGLWRNPGGNAVYRFRQIDNKLHWGIDAVPMGSFANVFEGDIRGAAIEGSWIDLPGSPFLAGGKLSLKIESECKIVKTGEVNHYGADIWVKQNSQCDVAAQAQRTNAAGAKPTTTNTKPAAAATNKQNGPVVVSDDRSGVFEKPKASPPAKPQPQTSAKPPTVTTVEVPEGNSTKVGANKPAPIDQETPDDDSSTKTAANRPARRANKPAPIDQETPEDSSSTKTAANTPARRRINPATTDQETPEDNSGTKTAANTPPRRNNQAKAKPRGAIRQGITQPTQQTTEQQPTEQQPTEQQPAQQPDGQCHGGSYWFGTPTPNSWVLNTPGGGIQIPWSTPIGVRGASLHVFSGGRDMWGANALPENANDCGLTYPLYPPAAGYYDAYLYDPSGRPVAGPVRFVVTPRQ